MGREIQGDEVTDNLHYERAVHGEKPLVFFFFFFKVQQWIPTKIQQEVRQVFLHFLSEEEKK